ncbi:hypothetical protein XNC1_4181 [Xenorhabdus nematophila ATCC 19061]|uniref:Uncharacterized protein n=2 Tax=Xenorhabdus nematophila TaxID=628 RepID=D3VDG6_XENNA|nr:hypothetical protein XNC1_4181 [Xenorhabdus nematophila ATCC 19061]
MGRREGMATNKMAAINKPITIERNNLISMALFSNEMSEKKSIKMQVAALLAALADPVTSLVM